MQPILDAYDARAILPEDGCAGALAGRIWRPELSGPSVVAVRQAAGGAPELVDITRAFPTIRDLCEAPDPAAALRGAVGETVGPLDAVLANTPPDTRDPSKPWLVAPIDLQAVKAAGVTFAVSMLERVIESGRAATRTPRRRSASRSGASSATTCAGSSPARRRRWR